MSGSAGFAIHPEQMKALGEYFVTIQGGYDGLMRHQIGCPRVGGDVIDRMLDATLATIHEMHTVQVQALGQHGSKLKESYHKWLNSEQATLLTVRQIRAYAAARGADIYDEEQAVLEQYFNTNPLGISPGPDDTTTINKAVQSSLTKIPAEVTIPVRRPWVTIFGGIISMDYRAVYELVPKLYWFVAQANPLVTDLSRRVTAFCDPYDNYGDAVAMFHSTYMEDACIMSGFHEVTAGVGQVVDTLAFKLADIEATLEEHAHDVGQRIPSPRMSKQNVANWATALADGAMFNRSLAPNVSSSRVREFGTTCMAQIETAENLRDEAAGQLGVLAKVITDGGLDFYTKNETGWTSRDPGGLLTSDDLNAAKAATSTLNADINADARAIPQLNLGTVIKDLNTIGGYGKNVGDLAGAVTGIYNADSLFGAGAQAGAFATGLGAVLTDMGELGVIAIA